MKIQIPVLPSIPWDTCGNKEGFYPISGQWTNLKTLKYIAMFIQGVPTCLGQAKYNILKLRSLPAKITNFTKKCILLHKIAF